VSRLVDFRPARCWSQWSLKLTSDESFGLLQMIGKLFLGYYKFTSKESDPRSTLGTAYGSAAAFIPLNTLTLKGKTVYLGHHNVPSPRTVASEWTLTCKTCMS